MRLVDIATERRVTILMFTVAILMFGFVSLARLKVNLLPDLSYPTITVRTELPGAAPLEIENLLSKPVEEAVGVIRNVRQVRSISRAGQSDVIIEFLWGTEMDFAGVDVREKLDVLDLPLEANRPLLLRFDPANDPILRLALTYGADAEAGAELSETQLKSLRLFAQEQLKNSLEAIEGSAAVKISGGLEDEIQILVDQDKLAQLDISIEQVATRIRAENINLSGGRLEQGSQRFLVRTINEFETVDQIAAAIIPTSGAQVVRLRDIAAVTRGYKEREAVTRVNGRESVELAVYKEGDANTVQVAKRVSAALESVEEDLPDNLELTKVYDQSVFIADAIDQVKLAALIGGLLAVLMLYLFLRDVRSTLVIGVAIPVSVIGTFVLMYASDLTLNIMSLGGIALAIGLLVDNSIVVLENIVRRKEKGDDVMTAARRGTSEVAGAVTAATLTTVAVFFPMVFVSGVAGQLFRDQALTVTFALLFSLLVAITLIPMLAAWNAGHRFADNDEEPPVVQRGRIGGFFAAIGGAITTGIAWLFHLLRALYAGFGRSLGLVLWPLAVVVQKLFSGLAAIYPGTLRWALRNRLLVVLIAAGIFGGTATLVPLLGAELIPQLSQGEYQVAIRLPPGTPLAQTDRLIRSVQDSAAAHPDTKLSFSVAGTGNRLDASPVDAGENAGSLNVQLNDGADRAAENRSMKALRTALQKLPGVQYEISRPALFSFSTPLEIEIAGFDLDRLRTASELVHARLEQSGRFADIKSSIEQGNPEIQIVFDHERAAQLDLVVRDIADRIVRKVRGEVATRYTWRDRKIDVLVRSVDTRQASVDEIRELIVNPQSERPVSLSAVADIRIANGPAEIRRTDQERVALLSANLAYGDLSTAVAEVNRILADVDLPRGIGAQVTGQNDEMQQSFASLKFTLALAVFLVYLVMAAQFESVIHPLVILFTIPLAFVGAVLALYLTGTTVNVVVLIGAIMLAGIVVNNAIVLVDLINQLRADGQDKHTAIIEAGQARLRPIVITTLTTALGLAPMAIGFGQGAEVRAPMAITVIGGLLMSTLLTLLVIPVVYSLLDRERARSLQIQDSADTQGEPAA